MKKKLFGMGMIVLLVFSQLVCASAKSKIAPLQPAGESADRYTVSELNSSVMENMVGTDAKMAEAIDKISNGEASLGALAAHQIDLEEQLKGVQMLTPFVNVAPVDGGLKLDNGNYLLHLSFPGLTSQIEDLRVLYYNAAKMLWEMITPSAIDWENKIVTMEVKDMSQLSLLSMVYKTESTDEAGETQSGNAQNTNTSVSDDETDKTTDSGVIHTGGTRVESTASDERNTDAGAERKEVVLKESNSQNTQTQAGTSSSAGSVAGESPKTGVESDWMIWIGTAGTLLVLAVFALKKWKYEA